MRISLWSHPRSRSTALERYFDNRGDLRTHHEVLADYYYVHLEAEPIDHASISDDTGRTYEEASALLLDDSEPSAHKDFPYHAIDELLADDRWLDGTHLVLVRDPRETLFSHLRLRGSVTSKNLGYADLLRWYRHLVAQGVDVHVVEAGRLNDDPVGTLRAVCEFAGLPFDERHLAWDADMRQDWSKWSGWHADVARSTGFGQASAVPDDWEVPADLRDVFEEAERAYAELTAGLAAGDATADATAGTTSTASRRHAAGEPADAGTYVVTGAAGGIGRALALRLADHGHDLLLVDVDEVGLKSVASEIGDAAATLTADLGTREGVDAAVAAVEALENPAALVNNAGVYRGNPLHTYDDDTIEADFRVNVIAPMMLGQAYARSVERRGGDGVILNVASTAGEIGSSDAVYGSSKAAVIGLTKSQAMNYAPRVRVNCVSPGMIRDTAIEDRIPDYRHAEYARQEQLDTRLDAASVAELMHTLVGPASRNLTAKVIGVDNGAYPR